MSLALSSDHFGPPTSPAFQWRPISVVSRDPIPLWRPRRSTVHLPSQLGRRRHLVVRPVGFHSTFTSGVGGDEEQSRAEAGEEEASVDSPDGLGGIHGREEGVECELLIRIRFQRKIAE